MVAEKKRMTTAEFEAFASRPENRERHFELINGEIVEKMPTQLHALIASLFNGFLFVYLQANPIGWIFSEVRVRLPGDHQDDVIPDIAFVLKQGRTFEADAPLGYMPDLVIEIQSPGQSDKFMADKAAFYLAHGARLVWIVYPSKRLMESLSLTDRQLLTEADTLEGGDVLPGFTLVVKAIFPHVD
jgi:Uma2 family endonuclease